jgi:hypothetical protein
MKRILLAFCFAALALVLPLAVFAADKGADAPMKAAIFIQNRAGADFADKIDVLNDLLTTRLTEKGFSVIDRSVVMAKFREARDLEPALQREVDALEKAMDGANAQAGPESSLSGASALRIAQMIGADYLVMASLTSFGQEIRTFKGEGTQYGSNNRSSIYTLRISVKVLEGNQGGSVYADTVAVAERIAVVEGLRIESSEIINKLLEAGAVKIAGNIGDKTGKIRDARTTVAAGVEFSVKSNIEGATVELDGAAIGSTPGRFTAAPGLHQLRVYKQWLAPWDKMVNVFAGQVLNISLELSKEGLKRYSTLENLKLDLAKTKMQTEAEGKERDANIEINKQQSDADAYSKKAIADGEKKKREDSYDRIEGAPGSVIYNK